MTGYLVNSRIKIGRVIIGANYPPAPPKYMECTFSDPLNYTGSPPAEGDPFAFSTMTCTDDRFQQYINGTTGSDFYVAKSLSYGDILVLVFLILFFCAGVFKLLWNFHFKDYPSKL